MFHLVKTEHWTNEKKDQRYFETTLNIYMFWKVDFLDNHCRLLCSDDVLQPLQLWSHKAMICTLTYWGNPPPCQTSSLWNQFVSSHGETSRTERFSLRDADQSVQLQLKRRLGSPLSLPLLHGGPVEDVPHACCLLLEELAVLSAVLGPGRVKRCGVLVHQVSVLGASRTAKVFDLMEAEEP